MKRDPIHLLMPVTIGVLCLIPHRALAAEDEPVLPANAVIATWEKVDAKFGWFVVEPSGQSRFSKVHEPGALPGFRLHTFPKGKLGLLPQPDVPFGLYLEINELTDVHVKELT